MRDLPNLPFTSATAIASWSNFSHTITGRPVAAFLTPGLGGTPLPDGQARAAALTSDLNEILTYCMTQAPERLCIIGSRWSLSNILDPADVILDPGVWNQIVFVNPAWSTDAYKSDASARGGVPVIVEGGTTISVLNTALGGAGLALQTSGASDGHRIAGCIATGTHGSDLKVGALHDTVLAMYVVIGPSQAVLLQPAARRFTADLAQWLQERTSLPTRDVADDDLFDAARVALGALGFVHSVIVEAVPLYELTGETLAKPLFDADVWHAMETLDTTALVPTPSPDFFSVILSPYAGDGDAGTHATMLWKRPATRPFQPPDPAQPGMSLDLSRLLSALIPLVDGGLVGDAVGAMITSSTSGEYPPGPVGPVFPGTYFGPTSTTEGDSRSSEVVVDHANTGAALRTVVSALQAEAAAGRHLLGGLGVRFVPGTTALLGMNCHAMSTFIEFPSLDSSDTTRIQQAVWRALRAAGIPFTCHWGQEYGMDAASVLAFYGDRAQRWKAARERLLTTPEARAVFSNPLIQAVGLGTTAPATPDAADVATFTASGDAPAPPIAAADPQDHDAPTA